MTQSGHSLSCGRYCLCRQSERRNFSYMGVVSELRRRNVLRMLVLYVVAAWLIMQVAEVVIGLANLPDWIGPGILILLAIGFPIALAFSWFYELTPKGVKLEKDIDPSISITKATGRRLDFLVISLLCAAVIMFAYDKWGMGDPPDRTIAVLPFENMSDDPGNEYFSDGVSEEILNLLAKIPELHVTSRSSAFSFKGQNLDVPTMAAKLNVAHVLEGSVRKSGNQLRITAQLIEVATDTHLWSKTYDRDLENIFAIQDEVAAAVVDSLKITLLGVKPKATETNPEAYALYLQARYFMSQGAEGHKQAESLLKQALDIDPGFAPAWTELGNVYNNQANMFGVRSVDEAVELARDAIQRALEIDPQYARAHAALGDLDIHYAYDLNKASRHMQQALALNPGDTYILGEAAHLEYMLGRADVAIDLYQQIIALDPLSPDGHIELGNTYYKVHRLEEAADSLQLGLSLNQSGGVVGGVVGRYYLSRVLLAQGDAPAALQEIEQVTNEFLRLTGTAIVQHGLGDAEASDTALGELIEEWGAEGGAEGGYQIAEIYAFRGEIEHAFDWLDIAYDNRDTGLPFMLLDPLLANLHDDPRWTDFLDKMGLPH